jgi:hypothetical protein
MPDVSPSGGSSMAHNQRHAVIGGDRRTFHFRRMFKLPAGDTLLQQINLKQTSAGHLIVGISEHVTYWNDLGWKDPYSLLVFTDRQSVYASNFSTEGNGTGHHLILFAQEQRQGAILGATTMPL